MEIHLCVVKGLRGHFWRSQVGARRDSARLASDVARLVLVRQVLSGKLGGAFRGLTRARWLEQAVPGQQRRGPGVSTTGGWQPCDAWNTLTLTPLACQCSILCLRMSWSSKRCQPTRSTVTAAERARRMRSLVQICWLASRLCVIQSYLMIQYGTPPHAAIWSRGSCENRENRGSPWTWHA